MWATGPHLAELVQRGPGASGRKADGWAKPLHTEEGDPERMRKMGGWREEERRLDHWLQGGSKSGRLVQRDSTRSLSSRAGSAKSLRLLSPPSLIGESPEEPGRDSCRRSVTGNMASKAKKRAVGNGVQRPLEAPSQQEEEEEDEVVEEEEDDEDSDVEEDEDDEIVDEVRGTRDHTFGVDLRRRKTI